MSGPATVRVFNVNKAVGYASSGVEYAQLYRHRLLAGIEGVDDRYVFTDYLSTNIGVFTDRLGLPRARVLWIYNVLSGRDTLPCTLVVDELIARIGQPHAAPRVLADVVEVALGGSPVRYRMRTVAGAGGEKLVDRVETLVGEQLIRVEHYDETLSNVEHFHDNRLARRVFYTPHGSVAAEQLYRDGEIARTVITSQSPLYSRPARAGRSRPSSFHGDVVLDGRSRFFQYVFDHLLSEPDDVVIVDRALDVIDGIYPVVGDRRLYSVVHAEHFDHKLVDDGVLLWNNHYEHVLTRPDLVDGLIVSTRRQQEVLAEQLASRGPSAQIPVACIPVGAVAEPAASSGYDPLALVTASRLADEKHIDVLIRAIDAAREKLPGLRLDIYGEGNRDRLLAVIEETRTQDCVRLMGHRELRGVLGSYALFVSASTSEGFGLSLLEAMAEGLPIVGFDVDYGNRDMVERGVNGRLIPRTNGDTDVAAMAAAIVEVLSGGDLDAMRCQSLRKASAYTVEKVRARWERLLKEGPC